MPGLFGLLLGVVLLFAGRRLFWLFVASLGFLAGVQLASRFPSISEQAVLLTGLFAGLILALLAFSLRRLAIGAVGFLAGGFLLTTFLSALGLGDGAFSWMIYLIGGVIGVILVLLLFDWTLILFSCLAGAGLILQALSTDSVAGGIIFIVLVIAGAIFQGAALRREK